MSVLVKFNSFVAALTEKKHNLATDQVKIALCDVAPVITNTVLANLTQIDYTHCSNRDVTTTSAGQTAGLYTLALEDIILTASGGSVGPFKYVVLYNDSATNDELIGFYEYPGGSITMADSESLSIDFAANTLTFQ